MTEQQLNIYAPPDLRGQSLTVGRYVLHRQIARGGMATIHIARLMGDEGFSRIVAAKRLHPEFAEDSEFVAMFLDEARIASKVHHRNVVPVLDLITAGEEVVLVQEYVHGAPLHWLLKNLYRTRAHVPTEIAVSIACQVLAGLHAAHETVDELGTPLQIVHRDVSPQNVMVSLDGSARLLDFGVAKATMAAHITREGTYKGKLAYSAPEQLRGAATRQSDIYSLSVLLWELLVGHRMHRRAKSSAELMATIVSGMLPTISAELAPERARGSISDADWRQLQLLEPIVKTGLATDAHERWTTASEMEEALAATVRPATSSAVAAWLKSVGKEFLEGRDRLIAAEEASWRRLQTTSGPLGDGPHSSVNLRVFGHGHGDATETASLTPESHMRRRPQAWYALLGTVLVALLVCIAIGVVLVVRGSYPPPAAPAQLPSFKPAVATPAAPPSEPASPQPEAPANAQAAPEPSLERTPDDPSAAAESTEGERQPVPSARSKTQARTRPPAARASAPNAQLAPPASETNVASANSECSPPYYFEGSKKIFKTSCL